MQYVKTHVWDLYYTGGILGLMSGWTKQDPPMLAVSIHQQSWACAAVTVEPCQHGGESLHYRARDCTLKELNTHLNTHTVSLLFDFLEGSIDQRSLPNL